MDLFLSYFPQKSREINAPGAVFGSVRWEKFCLMNGQT
jgi:hypothetical protein